MEIFNIRVYINYDTKQTICYYTQHYVQ